jgi:hypothetical protein
MAAKFELAPWSLSSGRWRSAAVAVLSELLDGWANEAAEGDGILCRCHCGSTAFELEADRNEGRAQRICAVCRTRHLVCDSAEYWEGAQPQGWTCAECQCKTCNLAVGFSLYEPEKGQQPDARWVSVGQRCTNCGTLGSVVDWKVGYGPSYQLLDQA